MTGSRRWGTWGLGLAVLAALLFGGERLWSSHRYEADLVRIRALMAKDRFDEAILPLRSLPRRWASLPEPTYRRGVCEHAVGNVQEALLTWDGLDPKDLWGARAGLARARTLVGDFGRFADAETTLERLVREAPVEVREEARQTLSELYFREGRRDAIRKLIERSWKNSKDPVVDLKDFWKIDSAPTLIEKIQQEVTRAGTLAPDDDRVWLAKANLGIQTGRFDEARAFLVRCRERRPDDPAVWRASLALARAEGDLPSVFQAEEKLPKGELSEAERLELIAWIAHRQGRADDERLALEALLKLRPGDSEAIDRLAAGAWDAGRRDQAASYRKQKAELDFVRDKYRLKLDEPVTPADLTNLARQAETLGRRFEAQGWWTLRRFYAPRDPEAGAALARLQAEPKGEPSERKPAIRSVETSTIKARSERVIPQFADEAEKAGLSFVFDNGRSPIRQIPETTGGGFGILDFDGDGLMDVYVLQGGRFPPENPRPANADRLFRNLGGNRFEDVTERSGIARLPGGYGHGVTVGDFDNDGDPDLFLTRWRSYALFRNKGDGTFEDATTAVGLGGDRDWPTSAAFADLDNDGDLDLYVCHYLTWDADHPTLCERVTNAAKKDRVDPDQRYNYCTPRPFLPLPDHLFRNDGGRFVDVSKEAGSSTRMGEAWASLRSTSTATAWSTSSSRTTRPRTTSGRTSAASGSRRPA